MQNPYPTRINDVRPEGHQSLSVIPRFMAGDYDRLQEHWKFEILFDYGHKLAEPGQLFWGIDTIEVKAGHATLQPQVRDLNDNLYTTPPGILLFNHWTSAPTLPSGIFPRYFNQAVAGFTEGNGSLGWGFGGESWINAAEPDNHNGGPYSVWASAHPEDFQPPQDRVMGSDCLSKIGWWDNYVILNPVFRIMRKAGTLPPVSGSYELRVFDQGGVYAGRVVLEDGTGNGGGRIGLFSGNVERAHVGLTD